MINEKFQIELKVFRIFGYSLTGICFLLFSIFSNQAFKPYYIAYYLGIPNTNTLDYILLNLFSLLCFGLFVLFYYISYKIIVEEVLK